MSGGGRVDGTVSCKSKSYNAAIRTDNLGIHFCWGSSVVLVRRKEASAHHGNDKARAGSAPVPRRVSFPEGECEEGRTLRGNAGTQAGRSCIGLWAEGHPGLRRLVWLRLLLLENHKHTLLVPSPFSLTHALPGCPHPDAWTVTQVWSPGTSLLSLPHTFLLSRAGGDSVVFHLQPSPWNRCRFVKHYTLFFHSHP